MFNHNQALNVGFATSALQAAYENSQLPPQPWTGDIASALSAVTSDLTTALDVLRSLDGRLFGVVPEPVLRGSMPEKPESIAADFSDRLQALRELAEALVGRAQRLNNRI
jgi:hypothetical protein